MTQSKNPLNNNSDCEKVLEYRPWGYFFTISESPNHKIKIITVLPGGRLSLQKHKYRSEHWFVLQGCGVLTLDNIERQLATGDSADIPSGVFHRINNTGREDLVLVEIQTGQYFGEDDIERIADDYGRLE